MPARSAACWLDNDVDHAVASLLRSLGDDVVAASGVGLGGAVPAADDEGTVYATNRGMVGVTHDREFTARRKRHTIGLHVRLMCAQPDAVAVLRERHAELRDVLSWTTWRWSRCTARASGIIHRGGSDAFLLRGLGPILGPNWAYYGDRQRTHTDVFLQVTDVYGRRRMGRPSMAWKRSGVRFPLAPPPKTQVNGLQRTRRLWITTLT